MRSSLSFEQLFLIAFPLLHFRESLCGSLDYIYFFYFGRDAFSMTVNLLPLPCLSFHVSKKSRWEVAGVDEGDADSRKAEDNLNQKKMGSGMRRRSRTKSGSASVTHAVRWKKATAA